jgi:predicted nucleotidyltransferase
MASKLAELLFTEYRRRVLGLLLLHPDEAYHVREIARLTGTVAGTLHKELSKLANAGILLKQTSGNQVLYQANQQCLIFDELSGILRKTSGVVDVLSDALAPLAKQIVSAFVFGSVASGKATSTSDIDLMIVGDVRFADVVKATYNVQPMLGREINPKIYNTKEWKTMLKKKDAFIKEVLAKPKLFILGDEHGLG